MAYVEGFVVPVPKRKLEAYRKMARKGGKIWCEHGALGFYQFVADDVPYGKRTSFPRAVKVKPAETVVFAYIVFRSRKQRDRISAKVMTDKRVASAMNEKRWPFDTKRMIFGGFKSIIAL